MSTETDDSRALFAAVLAVVMVIGSVGLGAGAAIAGPATQPPPDADAPSAGAGIDNLPMQPTARAAIQDGTEEVALEESVITQQRGDVVALNFTFDGGAEEARVTLGDSEAVSYEVTFTVRDGDGDGTATVLWNTLRSHEPGAGLTVAGEEDLIVEGPTVVDDVNDPVEPAEYPVSVVTVATGVETGLGVITIEERATENLTVHTAPASRQAFGSAAAVERNASNAAAGETIAVGNRTHDWVILRLAATGLTNYIDGVADLDDDADGVALTVTEAEESVGMNENATELQLEGNATLYQGDDEDVYYLAFRASALLDAGAEVGDRFVANATVDETNPVTATNETRTATFTLVEGQASVDLQNGQLAAATGDATVTGTSTWAPGTNLSVRLRSTDTSDGATPFTARNSGVIVADDGTWNAAFDLSEQAPGQQVNATVVHVQSGATLVRVGGELR